MSASKNSSGVLVAGGPAAMLASTCCLRPLLLAGLGFSGAWDRQSDHLGTLPRRFTGATLITMFLACCRVFRPAQACNLGEICAVPQRTAYKLIFRVVAVRILIAPVFPQALPLSY